MFDQFKEKIHSVQLDLNAGLKSLSEKAREVGRSKKLPGELHVLDSKTADLASLKPECVDAGDEILNRFQQMWTQLHVNIEFSAEKATKSDKVILELVEHHDKQVHVWKQFQTRLQEVPGMVTQIQNLAVTLGKLEANFEEIESMLEGLEDTCEEEELLGNKKIQLAEFMKYKEQKSKERLQRRERLLDEYNQKFRRLEDREDAKKKERQKAFQEVFAADMAHYKTHGKMSAPVTQSSQELENRLDEFEITVDRDDQLALDDFLGPDDEDEEVSRSSSRKRVPVTKDDESNDGDDEDEEEAAAKVEGVASLDKREERIGQSGDEKLTEESKGSDSVNSEVTESKDEANISEEQTCIEDGEEDSTENSEDKQQHPENAATRDGLKEEEEEEEEDDDFGTPDEDAEESTSKS
ncbi:dysbindin-like [Lytechinus variegatus]|uniref:dysbindin-like n=1 Tax=Lytechinus variegatus TaxID=7654 RepID=UPI001BB27C85|nr:dysbindin-like [Lytechinus variegatus]